MSQFPKAKPSGGGRRTRGPKPVRTHPFVDSLSTTYGERICSCGALESSRVHDVPVVVEEPGDISARILGESD